jgi:hypothetical protein
MKKYKIEGEEGHKFEKSNNMREMKAHNLRDREITQMNQTNDEQTNNI